MHRIYLEDINSERTTDEIEEDEMRYERARSAWESQWDELGGPPIPLGLSQLSARSRSWRR